MRRERGLVRQALEEQQRMMRENMRYGALAAARAPCYLQGNKGASGEERRRRAGAARTPS